jgi:hypothetical protein
MTREIKLIESLSTVTLSRAEAVLRSPRPGVTSLEPARSGEPSVCKGKRASQTKRRKFNRLRGGQEHTSAPKSPNDSTVRYL